MRALSRSTIAGAALAIGYWAGWAYPAAGSHCVTAVLHRARFPKIGKPKNRA